MSKPVSPPPPFTPQGIAHVAGATLRSTQPCHPPCATASTLRAPSSPNCVITNNVTYGYTIAACLSRQLPIRTRGRWDVAQNHSAHVPPIHPSQQQQHASRPVTHTGIAGGCPSRPLRWSAAVERCRFRLPPQASLHTSDLQGLVWLWFIQSAVANFSGCFRDRLADVSTVADES